MTLINVYHVGATFNAKNFPLPWWEGIKGRGKEKYLKISLFFHPHPNPPPSRGRGFLCRWGEICGIKKVPLF
jgi:hypothetical protein